MKHINISKVAMDRLKKKLLNSIQQADIGYRLEVIGDELSEFSINIRLDKKHAGDDVFETDGIKMFLDPESNFPFEEYQLDYENETEKGFIVKTVQEV